jgi:hypothetical protein
VEEVSGGLGTPPRPGLARTRRERRSEEKIDRPEKGWLRIHRSDPNTA